MIVLLAPALPTKYPSRWKHDPSMVAVRDSSVRTRVNRCTHIAVVLCYDVHTQIQGSSLHCAGMREVCLLVGVLEHALLAWDIPLGTAAGSR
jgi:hypothetical protein